MKTNTKRINNVNFYQTTFRVAIIYVAFLLCYSCAPIEVKVDYNKDINFNNYKTYAWIDNEQPDIVDINFEKEVLDRLVMDATDRILQNRNFSLNSDPDFLITYYLVVNAKTDVYMVENYYSDIGYATPPVTSSTRDYQKLRKTTYEQGILILDIMDSKSKERIWRGYAQSRVGIYPEREKQEKRVKTAIKKILNDFPP
jgi:hypothetical protein